MKIEQKIALTQKILQEHDIDSWLIYDFHHINPLGREFLELPEKQIISRRFFYFIPKKGFPIKVVHRIEPNVLNHLPGDKKIYLTWSELIETLKSLLEDIDVCAMEYSPMNAIPTISKVDAGTVEMIRECGVEVVSSGLFLQHFTNCLSPHQIQDHISTGIFLENTRDQAFDLMRQALIKNEPITEYDVSKFVWDHFTKHGFVTEHFPICAFNENSADPHYTPKKGESKVLKKGDFILLDIFAKKDHPFSIYADMTNVAFAGASPPEKIQKVFEIVKQAQKEAISLIKKRYERKEIVKGFEADEMARDYIKAQGFGDFFTHRTGHNIFKVLHGPGANLDSLETLDDRPLLAMTCFSIEPGIYLPLEFGVRLETSVLIDANHEVNITCGYQDAIKCLLSHNEN